MSRADQCKLQCLKKLLPRCEAGLIESPCLQSAILNFIKTHNIQIEIFELTPNSRSHRKNGSSPCQKFLHCASSFKKKVNFGAQCGDGNVCHEFKCPQSNGHNPKVFNSQTNVSEEDLDRNSNVEHSKSASSQVDQLNQSQKLDYATGESSDKRLKVQMSDCGCQISSYNSVSTLPAATPPPSPFPTSHNTLENSGPQSDYGEISHYRQGTSPERLSTRSTPTPVPDPSRLKVPEISRTRTVTPVSICREDTVITATSREINAKNGVSEASPAQTLGAACECLFTQITQKSPKHLEFFNKVIERIENLMECEEKMKEKKKTPANVCTPETTILDELISKLTFIMQETIDQYNLSGDIKAQTLRARNENLDMEDFRPRSASSRRGSPAIMDNLSFDLADPDNVTVARTRDQIRPLSKGRTCSRTEFLSLRSDTRSSRDRSQVAVSGSEASDSDEKGDVAPMPQRIWKSCPKKKHCRTRSKRSISSRPSGRLSGSSRSNFEAGPSELPEINVIHPSNGGRGELTSSQNRYQSMGVQQQQSQRQEGVPKKRPCPGRLQQTEVRPVLENTVDESISWMNMDSTCQPELSQEQNGVSEQVRGSTDISGQTWVPSPAESFVRQSAPEQVSIYSADAIVDSRATSYMDLPTPKSVAMQNYVPQNIQTTATQYEPESNKAKDDSDKNIQTCEFEDLCTDTCSIKNVDSHKNIQTCEFEDSGTDTRSIKKVDSDKNIQAGKNGNKGLDECSKEDSNESIQADIEDECLGECSVPKGSDKNLKSCENGDKCPEECSKEESNKNIRAREHEELCTEKCAVTKPNKKSRVPVLQSRHQSLSRVLTEESINSPGTSSDEACRVGNKHLSKNGQDEFYIEYLNREKDKKKKEKREGGGDRRRVTITTPTRDRSPGMTPTNKRSTSRLNHDRRKPK